MSKTSDKRPLGHVPTGVLYEWDAAKGVSKYRRRQINAELRHRGLDYVSVR